MKITNTAVPVLVALMLVIAPLAAGCLSIPGPESAKKTPVITATPTTPVPAHTLRATPGKTTTIPIVTQDLARVTMSEETRYESKTCTQQGGTTVYPGQQCTGTWLAATDTFNCCSTQPVSTGNASNPVSMIPFNLSVSLDDNPGSILL